MSEVALVELTKRFGRDVVAVDRVSLTVQEGEFLTLLGPSGCGKTTTLRMIAGFERPTSGEIRFGGEAVTDLPPYRRGTGMVFQSLALFPHMTVAENVAYGLRMQGVKPSARDRRVREMLRLVRLEGLADRRPDQLSGGQRQRVAFARALAVHPRIFLLDEPFAALDRKLREEMQIELRRLQRKLGITTIFVTHNQREAFTLSDRVAVMRDGRVEQLAAPRELYERPATLFVADFVGTANFLPARPLGASGDGGKIPVELPEEGVRLEVPAAGAGRRAGGVAFTLVTRPEFIRILPKSAGSKAGIAARVDLVRFVGELVEFHLVTRGGRPLVATYQTREAPPVEAGAEVVAEWIPERVLLLEGSPP